MSHTTTITTTDHHVVSQSVDSQSGRQDDRTTAVSQDDGTARHGTAQATRATPRTALTHSVPSQRQTPLGGGPPRRKGGARLG